MRVTPWAVLDQATLKAVEAQGELLTRCGGTPWQASPPIETISDVFSR